MKHILTTLAALAIIAGCTQKANNATPVGPGLYAVEYHGHEYLINPNGGLLHSDSCPCWDAYKTDEIIYE